jgi:hypothetical protein
MNRNTFSAVRKILYASHFADVISIDSSGSNGIWKCNKNPHMFFVAGNDCRGIKSVAARIFSGDHLVEVVDHRQGWSDAYKTRESDARSVALILH